MSRSLDWGVSDGDEARERERQQRRWEGRDCPAELWQLQRATEAATHVLIVTCMHYNVHVHKHT